MSIYDRLKPVGITPEQTSYFSKPADELDPTLFRGDHLKDSIRRGVFSALEHYLAQHYSSPHSWTHIWLAGSGVSYLWQAARDPGDLDCLVGVDYPAFRRANQDYSGLADGEIQSILNDGLREDLWPLTSRWHGYELTFYALPGESITDLHPYAAYDVNDDGWTVHPSHEAAREVPQWDEISKIDANRTSEILGRYDKAIDQMSGASDPGLRMDAVSTARTAAWEGSMLYDEIHTGRNKAFSPEGNGFQDFHEYRYKAAKGTGVIKALGTLKDAIKGIQDDDDDEKYGGLPDARHTLIMAAIQNRYRG